MAAAVLAASLGVLWVAIEATTIITAFLVGQRRTRAAVEAAWKYVVICSTGIALALLGALLLGGAAGHAPGRAGLDWAGLLAAAAHLDPGVTRIAVALLILGFGTKAGLAPLHAWLPDAHGQAPAPVSALMSGVLLSVAFYAVLRVTAIADAALGNGFTRVLLAVLALASLALAASLLLAQRDYKRMLAYSSIEHMGLLALGAAASGPYPFRTVEGPGVYEIPVGPVHAGMIGPGHFRFSVVGETILNLKARLWFTHRGIEKLFHGRDSFQAVELAERISGDTAVGHTLAFCLAAEDALHLEVPGQACRLRAVLLEMERLYNHVADLGALCNDVGHAILNAHAGRIREQLLRLNHAVTGHRLLRGAIYPGGVTVKRLPDPGELAAAGTDTAEVVTLALGHSVVRDRFTGTAVLTRQQAADLGTLGYVARASGLTADARHDHPPPGADFPRTIHTNTAGDVLARFLVRAEEITASIRFITGQVRQLGSYQGTAPAGPPPAPGERRSGVGITEGWRGTIVHRVELAADGTLTRAKIADPSFFNWPALPVALDGTIVPDFPLANKSFNLSYAGNDL